MIDQDEVARSAGEGTLDRTTLATGQHCRGDICEGFEQDEVARSEGTGGARGTQRGRVRVRKL